MNEFEKITAEELQENPFNLIGSDWMLITSGNKNKYNTMTASWGGVGVLWNKNVATIYVRPQRYTFEFLEKNNLFTLSFFTDEYKKALAFCGKYSGRDYDKAKECNLSSMEIDNSIAFKEAKLVLVCKKLYYSDIKPKNFLAKEIDEANYPNKDYHRLYIGEIIDIYKSK